MVQSDIELHFKPEKHPLCFLLDSPILLSVIIVSYLLTYVFKFIPEIMVWVLVGALTVWVLIFIKHNRDCEETEIRVFPDRIESEVGMKNPKLIMIEFSNLKEVKSTQTYVQSLFKTYSIVFIYKSDFDETKDLVYTLRDFKDPHHICKTIEQAVNHAGLLKKMAKNN